MAVTVVPKLKKKVYSQAQENLAQDLKVVNATDLQLKVERFATLHAKLEEVKPIQKEYDLLKKQLAAETEGLEPTLDVTLNGIDHVVVFSPCSDTTVPPDIEQYSEAVSLEQFMATVTISVTEARKYLPETLFSSLFSTKHGSRRFKAVVAK